jgi:alkanesulfonate monooxygenase SsuD/methylene tetrahydromethanopterin reductase-like flavin-dependent oxidoreductase (luciferase family)
MAVNALIGGHLLRQSLGPLPVPAETLALIQRAYKAGKSIEMIDSLISDQIIAESGVVIAGTPEECIRQLDDMLGAAKPYGFDVFDMASPLGPDWNEAIDLICREIIPELDRRASHYTETRQRESN